MKMKKIKILILFLVCCITGISCYGAVDSNHSGTPHVEPHLATDAYDVKATVGGNADFAFALYGKLKDNDPNSNLFFSPYSISTTVSMTYAGARGETEKQMAKAMCFKLPKQNLYSVFGNLQKQLIQEEKSRGYQILLANALWGQKGEPVLKEFLDLNKNYYGADFTLLDFKNETEKSRGIINRWVEEKTKEKIQGLIPPGGVSPDTALVLTNAIYFKGEWKTKFRWWKTRRKDFYVTEKDKVEVHLMHLEKDFKYYGDEKMQALELPYKGDELSMLVLLPREIEGIKELEDTFTVETLNTLLPKTWNAKVDVYLPKFKVTWGTFVLNNTLAALGMPDAFDSEKADFSGMNGKRGFWISDVFHTAFIEVNEEGTEAAAATAVRMTRGSAGVSAVFRADHPFIFIIKDNRTGSILFIGRVMNPAKES